VRGSKRERVVQRERERERDRERGESGREKGGKKARDYSCLPKPYILNMKP